MTKNEINQMYVATCKICTLAESMRECHKCRFNVGLTESKKALHFRELRIGAMFTFIIWNRGKIAFTKTGNNTAEDEAGGNFNFVGNDLIETL